MCKSPKAPKPSPRLAEAPVAPMTDVDAVRQRNRKKGSKTILTGPRGKGSIL